MSNQFIFKQEDFFNLYLKYLFSSVPGNTALQSQYFYLDRKQALLSHFIAIE